MTLIGVRGDIYSRPVSVRSLFLIPMSLVSLGCGQRMIVNAPQAEDSGAMVFADSAVFSFPTPQRARWEWNHLDHLQIGEEQYIWEAIWDYGLSPSSLGQGFEVGIRFTGNREPRSGSLHDVLRSSDGRALLVPPRGLDVAFALEPEGALSATEHNGLVRVVLRRSPTLSRLISSHPDSVRLSARLHMIGEPPSTRVVRVKYTSHRY